MLEEKRYGSMKTKHYYTLGGILFIPEYSIRRKICWPFESGSSIKVGIPGWIDRDLDGIREVHHVEEMHVEPCNVRIVS